MTPNASRMSAPASMSSTTSSIEVREHCATTSGGVASMYAWAQATHDTTATVSNASSQMVASCCLRAKVSLPAKQMPRCLCSWSLNHAVSAGRTFAVVERWPVMFASLLVEVAVRKIATEIVCRLQHADAAKVHQHNVARL